MRESLIEIGRCICERRLCHGARGKDSVQPTFIFIDQSFRLPANMAALRAPAASLQTQNAFCICLQDDCLSK